MAKIAAQLYTLREYTRTPKEVATTLARVRKIGYEAVQLSGLGPIAPEELAKMLHEEGLEAAATHVSWQDLQQDLSRIVDNHRQWHCAYTAISSMPVEFRTQAGYAKFAELASSAASTLQTHGLSLSYHNHSFEFERIGTQTGLEIILGGAASALTAEIDTYWVQHGGADPAEWIGKLNGRVPLVHLKDMTVIDGQPAMAEVGEGNMNWTTILAALAACGTRWYMVEQDICQRDPFESLQISLNNLRSWGVG